MAYDPTATPGRRIALIAHDNKKRDMLEWVVAASASCAENVGAAVEAAEVD